MMSSEALRVLAEVSESQWGMITSAQARARGVSHMNLTRLTASGDLVRLSHGVYRDSGAPSGEHEELRAAWLATEPARLAYERVAERPGNAVVSGESASRLHDIGDLRGMKSEFTTPTRRQTQRSDVRYRTRVLPEQDVTVREGLPVTTRERTIADLVEDRQDLSIVGGVLRDAARQSHLDMDRLVELLSPLAERNGHGKGDGDSLLDDLLQVAGINLDNLAEQIVAIPDFGALITAKYLDSLPKIGATALGAALEVLKQVATLPPMSAYHEQFEAMAKTLGEVAMPSMPDLSVLSKAIASSEAMNTARLAGQLNAAEWTALAQATQSAKRKKEEVDS